MRSKPMAVRNRGEKSRVIQNLHEARSYFGRPGGRPVHAPKPQPGVSDTANIEKAAPRFKGAALRLLAKTAPLLGQPEPGELLVELGDLPAAVHDPLHAGPRGMRLR